MPVITISRQLGSLGSRIADRVAEQSGCKVVIREVINQAALRAGVPDVALSAIDDLGLFGIKPTAEDQAAYHLAIKDLMFELACDGNVVIVGRAGQVILHGYPGVLHVRIIAPVAIRTQRISERYKISKASALAQINASDRNRKRYLRLHYQADWNDPEWYDLVINTARLSLDAAANLIIAAAQNLPS
ncbi:MAG: cytidylate kinase-like family protein [Anaerolineaceae bacterium]